MAPRILVVATSDVPVDAITETIDRRYGADAEVKVVAPVSGLSRLDWLTNAEDDARRDAAARADEIADRVASDAVESHVGDTDPLQAIDDALRDFAADEVVLVTRGAEDTTWLESGAAESARERFNLPITHLVAGS